MKKKLMKPETEAFFSKVPKVPLKKSSFSPTYFLKKVQIFSVKKLVDKFCECRHKLLTQVFHQHQKNKKKVILSLSKKSGVFHQHFSQEFLHQSFLLPFKSFYAKYARCMHWESLFFVSWLCNQESPTQNVFL
jgi:hypothetical protein